MRRVGVLLSSAILGVAIGCAPVERSGPERSVTAPQTTMTVREARKRVGATITALYDGRYRKGTVQDLKINRHQITFAFAGDDRYDCVMTLAAMGNFSVRVRANGKADVASNGKDLGLTSVAKSGGGSTRSNGWAITVADFVLPPLDSERDALLFVDALLTLKAAEAAPDTEERDFAAFSEAARQWLAAESRPALSDDARLHKSLAEDAFKRKNFATALESYGDALEAHPMWPEGHYNAALLAAELEDYALAAHHMRRYLVLAPGAKDAGAAKDKLLLWQHKAKE